jgi:hypothetical protein
MRKRLGESGFVTLLAGLWLTAAAAAGCAGSSTEEQKDLGDAGPEARADQEPGLDVAADEASSPHDLFEAAAPEAEVQAPEAVELAGDLPIDLAAYCGNGVCDDGLGENCMGCPNDCGDCTVCGNGACEKGYPKEGAAECPQDCGPCGDGYCTQYENDPAHFCLLDCGVLCGDKVCDPQENVPTLEEYCAIDCGGCYDGICGYKDLLDPKLAWCMTADCLPECGNGMCEGMESYKVCPIDCVLCGDGVCGKVGDDIEGCPADCEKPCGDGKCEGGETPDGCPVDCGPCGDAVCGFSEALEGYCPQDCPPDCGDGECQTWEDDEVCFSDCACQPLCELAWNCGEDAGGCGIACGQCPEGIECVDHVCCVPSCKGKQCGEDGCGGTCGECQLPFGCVENQCACQPICELEGKDCGPDGCGATCGECDDGLFCTDDSCVDGVCQHDVPTKPVGGYCFLPLDEDDLSTLTCAADGAVHPLEPCKLCEPNGDPLGWTSLVDGTPCGLGKICFGGYCCDKGQGCAGKECGDDGCGGTCGTCQPGWFCVSGECTEEECYPDCYGKKCGDDGCGGSCGDCDDDVFCTIDACVDGLCEMEIQAGYCLIAAACAPDEAEDPADFCRVCEAGHSQTEWSFAPDGETCGVGKVCWMGSCCPHMANCAGRECGPDGCGGECGAGQPCAAGSGCVDGLCTPGACTTDCKLKQCGDDGCGGKCGDCPAGWECSLGKCQCKPDCAGKLCGHNGCWGSCGTCLKNFQCEAGQCVCDPECVGRQCGQDGCGGSCGTCAAGFACDKGKCICQPQCDGKLCGPDGCGATCGTCPASQFCSPDGQCADAPPGCAPSADPGCDGCACEACVCESLAECCQVSWELSCVAICSISCGGCGCQPQCAGKSCGPNGCGSVCGSCGAGNVCVDGTCVCLPSCTGKVCGTDGCGGTCGTCSAGEKCSMGKCVCAPQCDGKECGPDGCGASCGTCPGGKSCTEAGLCEQAPIACTAQNASQVCNDGQQCTKEVCVGGVCANEALPGGSDCDDCNPATALDQCAGTQCVGSPASCVLTADCAAVQCRSPNCAGGKCIYGNVPDGEACDDGLPFTDPDLCVSGECTGLYASCQPGMPFMCPSKGECFKTTCVNSECQIEPTEGQPCDDGDPCTPTSKCQGAKCTGTPTPGCVTKKCKCQGPKAILTCEGTDKWPDCGDCCGWHSLALGLGLDPNAEYPDGTKLCIPPEDADMCITIFCQ